MGAMAFILLLLAN